MTNKTQEVLKHLQSCRNITSMEAISLYGATRLSAIIFNLRKRGYMIANREEMDIDRYGNDCRYVRYMYLGHCSDSISKENEKNKRKYNKFVCGKLFSKISGILYGDK